MNKMEDKIYPPSSVPGIIHRAAINVAQSDAFINLLVSELELNIRSEAGGGCIYIQKTCDKASKELRNITIRSEFDGRNFVEISIKHGLTIRQIRRICNIRKNGE